MTLHRQDRLSRRVLAFAALTCASLAGAEFEWSIPKGFPRPIVPPDNLMTAAKVELGRHLFYDKRMSVNGKSSCATCHRRSLRLPTVAPTQKEPRANTIRAAA